MHTQHSIGHFVVENLISKMMQFSEYNLFIGGGSYVCIAMHIILIIHTGDQLTNEYSTKAIT